MLFRYFSAFFPVIAVLLVCVLGSSQTSAKGVDDSGLSLRDVLFDLSRRHSLQLLVSPQVVWPQKNSVKVAGHLPPVEQINTLLRQNSMQGRWLDEKTLVVFPKASTRQKKTEPKLHEEVVVTARRHGRNLQELGVTATVLAGGFLAEQRLFRPDSMASEVSSLQVKNVMISTNAVFTLRGVGHNSYTSNMSQAVGLYVDDVFLDSSSQLSMDLFDVERVEVLKGPQGSLFGRNTIGGVINVVNRQPAHEFDAYLNMDVGNYRYSAIQGAVGGSLTDSLAGRFAFTWRQQDEGFYHNRLTGHDHGGVKAGAWRAMLSWQPTPRWEVNANVFGMRDRSQQWLYDTYGLADPDQPSVDPQLGTVFAQDCDAVTQDSLALLPGCVMRSGYRDNDGDPFSGDFSLEPDIDASALGGVLSTRWLGNHSTLETITAVHSMDKRVAEDFDGSPFEAGDNFYRDDFFNVSQEVRWLSNHIESIHWVAGIYVDDKRIDSESLSRSVYRWSTDLLTPFKQRSRHQSLYAHAEWRVAPRWRLLGGVRYGRDVIDMDIRTVNLDPLGLGSAVIGQVHLPKGEVFRSQNRLRYGVWSGNLGLEYDLEGGGLLYASLANAYKSGGFTGSWILQEADARPYDKESMVNFELGYKWRSQQHALQGSLAAFAYRYRDQQLFASSGQGSWRIDNVADVHAMGFETDLRWRPSSSLSLSMGLSYLDAHLNDTASDDFRDVSGRKPFNSPRWSLKSRMQYTWPLNGGQNVVLDVDGYYQSAVFMSAANIELEAQKAYWLWNGSLSWQHPDWELRLWAKNLFDKHYIIEAFPNLEGRSVLRSVAEPRTWGLGVSFYW